MLKAISSITNAIGALNFKGTWNANTNTPTIVSGVGVKGDYFVVGVAGSTTIDGISNWGVGDWIAYNGSVWQRVEGGADLNGVNLSVSGTTTLSNLTASTALALNASKEIVSVTNTGTGDNVLATAPTLVGDVSLSTGNLVIGTSGKGIDFSATPGTGTSELLADYEEGTFTPVFANLTVGNGSVFGRYTKIGRVVHIQCGFTFGSTSSIAGNLGAVTSLPFVSLNVAANTFQMAMGSVFKPNVGWFNILSFLENNSSSLAVTSDFVSAAITSTSPTTFASGTTLTVAIAYQT